MPQGFGQEQLIKGRYLITKRLDKDKNLNENRSIGVFGYVYLALDTLEDNSPVVIKALKDDWIENQTIKKLFLKEAEALNRLKQESRIVRLLSSREQINGEVFFLEDAGRPFFVMEFIKGKNLRETLRAGKLKNKIVSHYVEQLAIALTSIHEQNIIHRDLKPENIMIVEKDNQPDQIKIIDFGTALVGYSAYFPSTIYTDTHQRPFVGTPAYASPEHLERNETAVGEVFTLAAIAYEMLTGKIAFLGNSIAQVKELQQKEVDFPAFLSGETIKVLRQGLALNPTKRYQKPIEFANDLQKALIDEQEVIPTIPITSAKPPTPENKWKKILPIAAILAFLAAGLFGLNYWNASNSAEISNTNTTVSPIISPQTAEILFSYSFDVQKMKNNLIDGKVFSTADISKIAFGDKFNLKVEREKDGNFYIIEQNGEVFEKIFPNEDKDAKSISAWRVSKPNQTFWFVRSNTSINFLENSPANQAEIRRFLHENQKTLETKANLNKIEVKGSDNLTVYKFSM